jgi:two-component system phosphate regulon sensor histidine kinase PhoR
MNDFSVKPKKNGVTEFDQFSDALGQLADSMAEKMSAFKEELISDAAVLKSIDDGALAVDRAGVIIRINPAAKQLLTILQDRPEGEPLRSLCDEGALLRFVDEGLRVRDIAVREIIIDRPTETVVRASRAPLYAADNSFIGLALAMSDITELKRLGALRRDFAANVSHELRTPITAIIGYVETLKTGGGDDPVRRARFLDIIDKNALRLGAIVEDMLILSQVERTRDERSLDRPPCSIATVIAGAIDEASERIAQREVTLQVACPADLFAPVNERLLTRAIFNLVDNAAAYSPAGAVVIVTASATGGLLSIAVKDTGPGIDPALHDRLFERFFRVDAGRSRERGGTGLGLSIVKHVALAHNGRVSVGGAPGQGSVFSIHLPTRVS